jgi:leader peptidase (prepilin peptidase)/N-methyltransferase
MELELILWTGYVFVIGLMFGSFFNVVGLRVPHGQSLMGRSACPSCDHTLGVVELIPVIGYLVLRGRCKHCKSKISIRYPLIELVTALLFAFSFVILHETMVEYMVIVAFVSLLVIVTVSDLAYREVPDVILIVFAPILLGLRVFSPMPWYEGLIGAALGFSFMLFMAWYGKKRFGQEALGGGDIKLYALIGLVLGYNTVFLSVLFAGLSGLLYYALFRPEGRYLPFVPFIAIGSILAYFTGPAIIQWYVSLIM